MTYLHCLQHSLFEHLFNLYCSLVRKIFFREVCIGLGKDITKASNADWS